MTLGILTSQVSVEVTTAAIFVLTLALALVITKRYSVKMTRSLAFWSAGLWMFVIGVFLETLFAIGTYSEFLIGAYLFIVAILVELLALGSIQLVKNQTIKNNYYAFSVLSTLLLAYFLIKDNIGYILTYHVVYGNLSAAITIVSSVITFPAASILVIVAAKSYLARKSKKMLSIIAGVLIVSVAGTLYIVQYPAFLYAAEFVGILALWYGFI